MDHQDFVPGCDDDDDENEDQKDHVSVLKPDALFLFFADCVVGSILFQEESFFVFLVAHQDSYTRVKD